MRAEGEWPLDIELVVMLESPHQNRLIMENFDFKETFFSQERELERERRGRAAIQEWFTWCVEGHERTRYQLLLS